MDKPSATGIGFTLDQQMTEGQREIIQAAKDGAEIEAMDRGDVEMLFRCMMQFARHLAKKYGFTIKQWPEK